MNTRIINVFLAFFWAFVGISILVVDSAGDRPRLGIPALGGISLGWLALLLAGYNLLRWYIVRVSRHPDLTLQESEPSLRPARRSRDAEPEEPNPDFDFNRRRQPPDSPN